MRCTLLISLFLFVASCGSDSSGSSQSAGTITLGPNQGVDFGSGDLIETGGAPFSKSDLYAVENGDELRLDTGGATITQNAPFLIFPKGGYESLDDIPNVAPQESDRGPLLNPAAGTGFVLQNYLDGGYTKGRIIETSPSAVTIEWERLVLE